MTESPERPTDDSLSDDLTRLQRLHETTRGLMAAETKVAVATVATETAESVLGLDVSAVFFPNGEGLVPVAATEAAVDLFDEIPTMRRGESIGWRVFDRGEPAVFDDVRDAAVVQNPRTPMRSELLLPLGEHGLFIAGTTDVAEFEAERISLAKLFADNVEVALDRAEREERLTKQNERLDRFASVVSHDLRNPLNVAQGRLELAREECESEHLRHIAGAHERIEELLIDLLALAREGRPVGETEPVSLSAVVREAESDVPEPLDVAVDGTRYRSGGSTDTDAESTGEGGGEWTVEADRGRLRELLSNLLANAANHGADAVRVGLLDQGGGFYVTDDGPGVDPEERARVFEHGYTTTEEGTGFGLAIVEEIATAHGWTVDLVESDGGGLRVEVRTGGGPGYANAVDGVSE